MADLTTQNGNGFDDSCGSSSSFASSSSSSLLKAAQICWENTLEEEKKQRGQPLDVLTAAAHKKNSEYVQQESMLSVVTGEGSENTIARYRTRSLKLENSNVISGCQRRNYQGRKDCGQSFPLSLSIFFTAIILMVCVMSEVVSGSFNDELDLEKSTVFAINEIGQNENIKLHEENGKSGGTAKTETSTVGAPGHPADITTTAITTTTTSTITTPWVRLSMATCFFFLAICTSNNGNGKLKPGSGVMKWMSALLLLLPVVRSNCDCSDGEYLRQTSGQFKTPTTELACKDPGAFCKWTVQGQVVFSTRNFPDVNCSYGTGTGAKIYNTDTHKYIFAQTCNDNLRAGACSAQSVNAVNALAYEGQTTLCLHNSDTVTSASVAETKTLEYDISLNEAFKVEEVPCTVDMLQHQQLHDPPRKVGDNCVPPKNIPCTAFPGMFTWTNTVNVTVSSSDPVNCVLSDPKTFLFQSCTHSLPQTVTLTVGSDDIAQIDNPNQFTKCTLTHTITSNEGMYKVALPQDFVVFITDDDVADTKIRPTTTNVASDGTSSITVLDHKLKFLGPLTLTEGDSDQYGIQLDTKPIGNVTVSVSIALPRAESPASIHVHPSTLVFQPSMWTNSQVLMVTVTVINDDVDSVRDLEDFTLTHAVTSAGAAVITAPGPVCEDSTGGMWYWSGNTRQWGNYSEICATYVSNERCVDGEDRYELDVDGNCCECGKKKKDVYLMALNYMDNVLRYMDAEIVNLTVVVRVQDDDTAGIIACAKVDTTCQSVMNLIEGDATGTIFEITRLKSKPLHDVTLTISVDGPALTNLITIEPSTLLIPVDNWNKINQKIKVTGAIGQYGDLSSFVLKISATSQDDKYNTTKSPTMKFEQPTAVTITSKQAGLVGVPTDQQRWTEGGVFLYKVQLNVKPKDQATVTVTLISSEQRCNILTGNKLSFTENNWNKEQEINIEASDDTVYYAKGAVSYTCLVTHGVTSTDATVYASNSLTLDVLSTGCGAGEFIGEYDRLNSGKQCVCRPSYFIPPNRECTKCPIKESDCDQIGLLVPNIKPGYWRSDPTSPNITTIPFYSCPFPNTCFGGNSTQGSCATGHDSNSPVCATCVPEYVLQGEACVSCPGKNSGAPIGMYGITVALLLLLFIGFVAILRKPALSKADEQRIIDLLKSVNIETLFRTIEITLIDMNSFNNALDTLRASLSKVQIEQLFKKIDEDGSGQISKAELLKFINPQQSIEEGITATAMQDTKDDVDDKQSNLNEVENYASQLGNATKVSSPVGGIFMKIKLLVGFGQVLSYYPVTFDSIPWPVDLANFMKLFQIFSVDIFSIFGAASCQLQTDFLTKFTFHMLLIPLILIVLTVAFILVLGMSKLSKVFTPKSVKTSYYTLVSLILYTLYVGVSTRIFRLFKCREIMGTWYLTADYTVICFEGAWSSTSTIAFICVVVFVVGIPLGQFLVLCANRRYIDEQKCIHKEDYVKHLEIKHKYGSIFEAYTPECYYYDLVDLIRRLTLTGGLILVGNEEAVAQVFLGILISTIWLCVVLYMKPYASAWDTALSGVLSFVLTITLVSGVSMRLYELTLDGTDVYQRNAFGAVLIGAIVVCLLLSIGAVVLSTECLRDKAATLCMSETKQKSTAGREATMVVPRTDKQPQLKRQHTEVEL